MIKKTYKGQSDVNVRVLLEYGLSAQIDFAPLIDGSSVFETTDTDLQSALESHARYGKLFYLDSTTTVAKAVTNPKVVYYDRESDTGNVLTFNPQSLTPEEQAQARENINAQQQESAVLYTSQTLTEAQREQARTNIGAASEPAELQNVLRYVPQTLSSSEKAQARENIDAEPFAAVITDEEMAAVLG